jgi:hypothetical protein
VLKWGFVLLTAYTGPLGAFLYALGCREPLPGLHEQYVAARWRQVLGSAMHCVAGDGVGIIAGALIAAHVKLSPIAGMALEYVLGFGFGWLIFQARFMRDMAVATAGVHAAMPMAPMAGMEHGAMADMQHATPPSGASIAGMTIVSFVALTFGVVVALASGGH